MVNHPMETKTKYLVSKEGRSGREGSLEEVMPDGSYRMGVCGGRCNRSGPSLDKGPKEGRNTWALGQGEVTEEQEGREGMRLRPASAPEGVWVSPMALHFLAH